jgi:Alpha/beta hydrolase family
LWSGPPQPLLPEATAALASTPGATFQEGPGGRLTFTATSAPPDTGLVLYTGGKVEPAAYAPAARAIAEAGYLVVIVPAPLSFAILDTGAAGPAIAEYPEIATWAVGAHSLGGASAALFIDGNHGVVDGLALWASFSSADIADEDLTVTLLYGSLDAGAAGFTSPEALARLGDHVTITVIEGGNHEQMGWYTGQPNDPPATISREDQQSQVVDATVDLLEAIDPSP